MANARRGGFIRGFGGMFSFIDVINRRLFAETPAEADAEALREDWERVGSYLYNAMGVYKTEHILYSDDNGKTWKTKTADEQPT